MTLALPGPRGAEPVEVLPALPPGAATAPPATQYVGLVTRALAFALDAALINAVAFAVGVAASLVVSIVSIPDGWVAVVVAAAGAAYLLWTAAYFVAFWSTTGQTPGCRALRVRVTDPTGQTLRPRRALLRFLALLVAALPLFAGFLLILVDDRRRGLHDLLAGTVVVDAPRAQRRAGARATPRA